MTQEEKIGLLEEMFEADAGTIQPETALDTLQWDSMAMLSLIALVNEKFGKKTCTGDEIIEYFNKLI